MPGHKAHITIGAILLVVTLFIVHYFQLISTKITGIQWILLVAITFVYSQLPDIDQDLSKINKLWNTAAGIGAIVTIITQKYIWLGVFAIVSIVALEWVRHRGFTHDVWFAVLISAPLWTIRPLMGIVAFVAYMSHIIADGEFGR